MAITASLRPVPTIAAAIETMGFVQYDPIRRPARAQDLILAQRVAGYRVGDLDRAYESSDLEEDDLHVYGAMPSAVLSLLHPRCDAHGQTITSVPSGLEADVLAAVKEHGRLHPNQARALLGDARTTNAWGGISSATTKALEALHHQGLVRVAHRHRGTKVYEPAAVRVVDLTPDERLRRLTLLLARLLAPVAERTLAVVLNQLQRRSGGIPRHPRVIADLRRSGELDAQDLDGVAYLWPAGGARPGGDASDGRVRFLAPFDPVVWDRDRFAHLWGWPYRLECYTPPNRRRFGYYALPMFWGHAAIGWVNCEPTPDRGVLVVATFVERRPRAKRFPSEFERAVTRLGATLGVAATGRQGAS